MPRIYFGETAEDRAFERLMQEKPQYSNFEEDEDERENEQRNRGAFGTSARLSGGRRDEDGRGVKWRKKPNL
jgi:hypothetical protein